ncbi:tyrosine-type recombinase/integrase [Paracoccus zhejiangensis]|uniref:Integrase n=1 Tax=Paracoccus zhejiangensis TaxID=1077935 RepID=A0A2H5F3C3_9RHOB|nr:integrase family protein [Paracoccus zhejiangensis]AUH66044.1 integrase [Paracoccus zhejiangensis]
MAEKIRITKRSVDALRATGARYIAWDTALSGFGVRVGPTGSKTYVLKYRVGGGRAGRVRWGVVGQHGALTPDQARVIAQRWTNEIAAGGDPAGDKQDRRQMPTVADLMNDYIKLHVEPRNKSSTAIYVQDIVERIICKDPIAKLKVSDVSTADLARLHARLINRPTTANRVRSALSTAFNLAETWGYRPRHSNPCQDVQKYPEKAKERYLSPPELAKLGAVLSKAEEGELQIEQGGKLRLRRINRSAIAAIRLLIFTGARKGEILGLRWEWIDMEAGHASLPDSKTGKKRILLPPAALEVLRGLDKPETGRGYVIRGGDFSDPEIPLVNIKDPWGLASADVV